MGWIQECGVMSHALLAHSSTHSLTHPSATNRNQPSEEAKAIVKGLLERRVANRLGCGPQGALEIKVSPCAGNQAGAVGIIRMITSLTTHSFKTKQRHPYFACYDWEKLLAKGYAPEFVPPRRRKSIDVDNFDK
jgi:hypothetical protein